MQTPSWAAHIPPSLAPALAWAVLLGVPFLLGLFFGKGWGTALYVLLCLAGITALVAITKLNELLRVVAMGAIGWIPAAAIGLWLGSSLRRRLQDRY